MLGPVDGGRTKATRELFCGDVIICTEDIRKALGHKTTDLSVFEVLEEVIKAGVLTGHRIVVNASLVELSRRRLITSMFPRHYKMFYIVCYKPLEDRIKVSTKTREFHNIQERKWLENKAQIQSGDCGLAMALAHPGDIIEVEG